MSFEQPPHRTMEEVIQEKLERKDPVATVTRAFLGRAASEGTIVVKPHEYQQMKQAAREVVAEHRQSQ